MKPSEFISKVKNAFPEDTLQIDVEQNTKVKFEDINLTELMHKYELRFIKNSVLKLKITVLSPIEDNYPVKIKVDNWDAKDNNGKKTKVDGIEENEMEEIIWEIIDQEFFK